MPTCHDDDGDGDDDDDGDGDDGDDDDHIDNDEDHDDDDDDGGAILEGEAGRFPGEVARILMWHTGSQLD